MTVANWRASLRPAAFRGVPFVASELTGTGGRRGPTHEYPGREEPYAEDLGRSARGFEVLGYVFEPQHGARADRLITALETPGPGALTHPWYGEKRVVCRSFTYSFRAEQGGAVEFRMSFAEAGRKRYPSGAVDGVGLTAAAGDDAEEAVGSRFASGFLADGFPGWVAGDATEQLGQWRQAAESALSPFVSAGDGLNEFSASITAMASGVSSLVYQPLALVDGVRAVLSLGNLTQGAMTWRDWLGLTDWAESLPDIPLLNGGTASRQRQAANRAAFRSLVRREAIIRASQTAAGQPFDTTDEAEAASAGLTQRIDAELAVAGDADYGALDGLRAAVVRAIAAQAPTLPRLRAVTLTAPMPSLALANRWYGDDPAAVAGRAEEIVARNAVRHPGRVPAGVPIQLALSGDAT